MAVRPVLVCDVDGADGGKVETYRITYPDGVVWEIELCPKDAKPLEDYRKKRQGREAKPRGRRRTFAVTPLDEIGKQPRKRP